MGRFTLVLGWLAGFATAVHAQSDSALTTAAGMVGLTYDQYYVDGGRLHGISLRGTGPDRAGVTHTFGAGYARNSEAPTTGIFALDLGLGNLSWLASVGVLVEVGATAVIGEGTGLLGGYGGLTLLLPVGRGVAIRVGASRRGYLREGSRGLWLLSVGLSRAPRRLR